MVVAARGDSDVLIVIDPQVDFCPGGALAVPYGDAIIPEVNRLAGLAPHVIVTQDWHPSDHASFASRHPGRQSFETIDLSYGPQTLWPDHCIQGTGGAEFHPGLELPNLELVLRKGFRREIDSYSAFRENDRHTPTGLAGYLRERGFAHLLLCGLATDYCVFFSAMDAREAGFGVTVALDACRGIDLDGSVTKALTAMREVGVTLR